MSNLPISHHLAPLQRVMLLDSLLSPRAGCHVEQVEIRFSRSEDELTVAAAWKETVTQTAALRLAFVIDRGDPTGWQFVTPEELDRRTGPAPDSWSGWLEQDRCRRILFPQVVPWRAVFWPEEMRFLWTFHHALLDGRSIARILEGFLKRMAGQAAEPLALSGWRPPTPEMKSLGDEMFRRVFADMKTIRSVPPESADATPAVRFLGNDFIRELESRAAAEGATVATLLIGAWGGAVSRLSGADSVVVEQLRAGEPQPGTAGFTMNLLPLRVGWGNLREQLLELRRIESLGEEDFSRRVFPDTSGPWSSVIMVERGTLEWQVRAPDSVESVTLHERKGESLSATAHLLPNLRLEVEGPCRHELLELWCQILIRGR